MRYPDPIEQLLNTIMVTRLVLTAIVVLGLIVSALVVVL